jgi:isopentenyl diphosphate isomerase/L-lactate dehydrogenase-like FMN-dependent dehydrogenase
MIRRRPVRVRNVAHAEQLARRRLPRSVYEFVEGGTEGAVTLHENERALREVEFRPHTAVETTDRRLGCNVVGCELAI